MAHGKLPEMDSKRVRRMFLLLIQTLPTFWATRIPILRFFIFWIFWIPNFQISRFQISSFQIYRFPAFQISKFSDFQISRFPDAAGAGAGWILRSQPDPSPNAPRDQIRRKVPCCDVFLHFSGPWKHQLKWPENKVGRFLRIQTLPKFGAERISILIILILLLSFFNPRFPGSQISGFPDFHADGRADGLTRTV